MADTSADWRLRIALRKGFRLFGATGGSAYAMREASITVAGTLEDLPGEARIVVDCAPKRVASKNVDLYRQLGHKFMLQGGEKAAISLLPKQVMQAAIDWESTRVVSCNTTSIVRTLTVLKNVGHLRRARGTLLRRATDPWENHRGGIMNTLVPEEEIPAIMDSTRRASTRTS